MSTINAIYRISVAGEPLHPVEQPAQSQGNATYPGIAYPVVNSTPVSVYLPTVIYYAGMGDGLVAHVPVTTHEPTIQAANYRELTDTLSQLRSDRDDWYIEPEVYNTSIQVAAALFDKNIPAPAVFSHGPKSVVFNWDDGENNFYLTIGKSRLWAAVSSASEVKTRLELTGPAKNVAGDFLSGLRQFFINRTLLAYDHTATSAS